MRTLTVYSRQGCHLCELLIEELVPMVRGRLAMVVRDIDTHPDWKDRYGARVPVIEFEDRLISEYPLNREAIADLLNSLP